MNITLPRAVIEQALEVCGIANRFIDSHYLPPGKEWHPEIEKVVIALRTALEQPEQEQVGWLYPEGLSALKAGKCWTAYGTKQEDNNIPIFCRKETT